jgi:hypothetical protein
MLKTVSSITNAIGALNYKGTWNASTNSPALASGVGTKGDYYVVSVAGSTNLDGETLWGVGDWAVYNGTAWQKVEGGNTINATTVSASTSVTTPVIQATSSAGGTLKNNGGTAQLQWGSGGGSNLSLEVATNINPANAAVNISPTGTGTVTINPATASTMNNVAIGGTTPLAITGTTITATSINKMAITAPATSSTLAIADGKTHTVNNSIALSGTDSTTMTFPTTSATIARTDAAQTFTGAQTFSSQPILSSLTASQAVATDASKGLVSVANTGTGNNVLATSPTFSATNDSSVFLNCTTGSGAYAGVMASFTTETTSVGQYQFINCTRTGVQEKFKVLDNGNVQNANNSYGAISDIKLKENISLSNSQWDDVKQLSQVVKKFNFIADESKIPQLGFIAQDVQKISPKLVISALDRDLTTGELLTTESLSVNYSIAYMKAFKALGEALIRIETLEEQIKGLIK